MKKIAFIVLMLICFQTVRCQSKPNSKEKISKLQIAKDSIPLFYGLKAEKILSFSVSQGKAFIKKHGISINDYFKARARAKIYLNKIQIKKDSSETMRIYDRIEQKLDMKKKNE